MEEKKIINKKRDIVNIQTKTASFGLEILIENL